MKEIWYFKILDDDYYGRPVRGISDLNCAKYTDVRESSIYHNAVEIFYKLDNGDEISNLKWYIFDNIKDAVERYNEAITQQIKQCNEHIDILIEIRTKLENKLIKSL